ncbi:MAG: hypothetical protein AB1486_28500 [Planctomycetota bacterium]
MGLAIGLAAVICMSRGTPEDEIAIYRDLQALSESLDKASEPEEVLVIVLSFAETHRPDAGTAQFLSPDRKVYFVVGADGGESPHGASIDLHPQGSKYNVAVAGDGASGKDGKGGNGGEIKLCGEVASVLIMVAGDGGNGSDATAGNGHAGGRGGSIWCGEHPVRASWLWAGRGGKGGMGGPGGTGGSGGAGGSAQGPPGYPGGSGVHVLRSRPGDDYPPQTTDMRILHTSMEHFTITGSWQVDVYPNQTVYTAAGKTSVTLCRGREVATYTFDEGETLTTSPSRHVVLKFKPSSHR